MHRALRLCALLQTPSCQPSPLAEIGRAFSFFLSQRCKLPRTPPLAEWQGKRGEKARARDKLTKKRSVMIVFEERRTWR